MLAHPLKYAIGLVLMSASVWGQTPVCATAYEPHTINSTWTQQACNAKSAGGGEYLCGAGSTCVGKTLALFHDVAVNVGDTALHFCDGDGDETAIPAIAVGDNALGNGTVNTANSGGNTVLTRATGSNFAAGWVGGSVLMGGVQYTVVTFTDTTHITVSGNAGTGTGVTYAAGNAFTKLPQTNFDFLNGTRHVIGNYFYLLGSAYVKASGYKISCELTVPTGTIFDMDQGNSIYRQTSGLPSGGLDASTVWTTGASASGSCVNGPNSNGCLQATTPAITRSVVNDLVIGVQQQNNGTAGMSFTSGSTIGCDNDGTTVVFTGFYYYTACSSTAATGSMTMSSYGDGASVNFANVLLALKPASSTRYIASSAGVFSGGSACNGKTAITPATWNATALAPDDITWICGTLTFTAGTVGLIPNGSGTAGHPIVINFDAGAIVQSQVCAPDGGGVGNGGCISLFNKSYITVDGKNTGSATLGTLTGGGIIRNTDNGDALGHHCNTKASPNSDCLSTLIDASKCSNCTVQNLQMPNTYVKVLNNVATGVGGDQQHAIVISGTNIIVTNNSIPNCGWCIFDNYTNGDTNVNVFLNDISGFGHGMMYATANAGAASVAPALRFYSNHIHDPNVWTTPACDFHNDGLHTFGLLTGTSMDGLYIHDNYFNGTWGHCATGFVYIENGSSNPSHARNWAVWNNVGDATTETTWDNTNGWFGLFSGESGTQKVFNNTVLCGGPTHNMLGISMQTLSALSYENNVNSGCAEVVEISSSTVSVANFNFYGPSCGNGGNCFVFNGAFKSSFPAWKTACACDANGILNNTPLLNSDGSPQSGSPVIGIATNLTGSATGELAGLVNDTTLGGTRTALVRPSSGAWDAGAFRIVGAPPPPPPTSLTSVVH